ncbi:unnamed protein product, partial [Arabidopsis halleri]
LASEQDVDGNTPLHLATIKWRPRAVCELGGQKNLLIQNNRGLTALDIAESKLKPHYIYREVCLIYFFFYSRIGYLQLVTLEFGLQRLRQRSSSSGSSYRLIATVTFTAGFTLPGGFKSSTPNLGMANLATNPGLFLFLLYDILALETSFVAVVSLILAQLGDPALYQSTVRLAMASVCVSIYSMSLAFLVAMVIAAGNVIWLIVFFIILILPFIGVIISMFFPHFVLHY